MRYSNILKVGANNELVLVLQGCPRKCKGCFSPETWDYQGGEEWTQKTEQEIIKLLQELKVSRFVISGGEPLLFRNYVPLNHLLQQVKKFFPQIEIWCYTGRLIEEFFNESEYSPKAPVHYVDILIDGPFIQELKNDNGSSNQRFLDCQRTLEEKQIILKEFQDEL